MNVAKLKGLMAERGETQKDLAKILSISSIHIGRKLKSEYDFTASELKTIADHYNVSIDYFFKN